MTAEVDVLIRTLRGSHDRLRRRVESLETKDLQRTSFCSQWSVAQVLSHLGSQAEFFELLLNAGRTGGGPPGQEIMAPIWARWDALPPAEQAEQSVAANERLVARLEGMGAELDTFHLALWGGEVDAAGLLRMRLAEHAVHSWDVAVTNESDAVVAADAVERLIDHLGATAARGGRPADQPMSIAVTTSAPVRQLQLDTGGVSLEPFAGGAVAAAVELPAEALLRLVYGRLDPGHPGPGPVATRGVELDQLRAVFPGF
ncbi:MAG TPA: maleylpyruvate isomerase family mycothiol-dependent enzyme [Acidimicrobiales bacterium]|nr:maleylpyruvate isomerase family mycothiol-dependent enzyme [Acidimicrobiales bacterium]